MHCIICSACCTVQCILPQILHHILYYILVILLQCILLLISTAMHIALHNMHNMQCTLHFSYELHCILHCVCFKFNMSTAEPQYFPLHWIVQCAISLQYINSNTFRCIQYSPPIEYSIEHCIVGLISRLVTPGPAAQGFYSALNAIIQKQQSYNIYLQHMSISVRNIRSQLVLHEQYIKFKA